MNVEENTFQGGQDPSDTERVIIRVIKTKGMMTAVKTYMEITGHSLKRSKEDVEEIACKYEAHAPESGKSGCASVLILCFVLLILISVTM